MAIQISLGETNLTRIVQAIVELIAGRQNSVGEFTLTPGASTTLVSFVNCSSACEVQFSPRTASAAAEVGNGTIWVSSIANGSFLVHHANSGVADRVFGFAAIGG